MPYQATRVRLVNVYITCSCPLKHALDLSLYESGNRHMTYSMNKEDGSDRFGTILRFGKDIGVSSTINISRLIFDSRVINSEFI